ncbi:hypothetical protein JCM19047_3440 [Bacillus sp. JCM 19047]|nr:hypothetical protein JCM19047_3440 [Bacillus sp. JCM 19047]
MDLLVLFYLIFTVVLIRYTVAKTRRPKGFFISGMLVLIIGFACLFILATVPEGERIEIGIAGVVVLATSFLIGGSLLFTSMIIALYRTVHSKK